MKRVLICVLLIGTFSGCLEVPWSEVPPVTQGEIDLAQEWLNLHFPDASDVILYRYRKGDLSLAFDTEQRDRTVRHFYTINKDGNVTYDGTRVMKEVE